MEIEDERRFLVKRRPRNLGRFKKVEIDQGYLVITDDKEARLRREDGRRHFQAVKIGGGRKRLAPEAKVSRKFFNEFWPATEDFRLRKTRYFIPHGRHILHLDVFHDELEGYEHVETEFKSKRKGDRFVPPSWFGREVTDNPAHNGKNLARYGIPKDEPSVLVGDGKGEKIVISAETKKQIDAVIAKMEEIGKTKDRVCVLDSAGTGAGKGVLTKAIKIHFGSDAEELAVDNYYRGVPFMEAEKKKGNILNWDEPAAVELDLAAKHIESLLQGKSVKAPTYSFETGLRGKRGTIHPAKYLIVDGNFAFHEKILPFGDIKNFMDVGVYGRMLRRLIRDVSLNRTKWKPADVMEYFLGVAQPMHEKYIESQKMKADFIITNEYNPEVETPKAGMSETQIKFPELVDSELLRKAGAVWVASIEQVDRYYSPRDRNILKNGEALRIRQEGRNFILIYKGPECKGSKLCNRPTIPPFQINEETVGHFVEIFGEELLEIRKNRTIFLLDGVVVCRDGGVTQYWHGGGRILTLGDFTEIRCAETTGKHDCEKVALVTEKLGFDLDKGIKTPYAQM